MLGSIEFALELEILIGSFLRRGRGRPKFAFTSDCSCSTTKGNPKEVVGYLERPVTVDC